MKTIAIVPAKAHSRRLPGKNRLTLDDQPLWALAALQALEAGVTDVVVTTDDESILKHPLRRLATRTTEIIKHRRPDHLAGDNARIENTVYDVLKAHPGYEVAVILNPTHPLRKVEDIQACIDACGTFPSCTTVRRDYSYTLAEAFRMQHIDSQGRCPRLVATGSVYAVRTAAFLEFGKLIVFGNVTKGTYVEETGPHVDIDTEADYIAAKAVWEHVHAKAVTV